MCNEPTQKIVTVICPLLSSLALPSKGAMRFTGTTLQGQKQLYDPVQSCHLRQRLKLLPILALNMNHTELFTMACEFL